MNALDMLKTWPGLCEATAEEIFAHPAWAVPCQWGDERCCLRRAAAKPRDVIGISITLDDDAHFLGLANCENFPDLSELWYQKKELPPNLVLALVEKECGALLQMIENLARRQVRVIGLDDVEKRASALAFEVVSLMDGSLRATFVLDIRPSMVRTFGQLRFLNVRHEAIRLMERDARWVYALFDLTESDISNLSVGDYLMLPELDENVAGEWICEIPHDNHLRVIARDVQLISFAAFVDETMPSMPTPMALELYRGNTLIARGRYGKLCNRATFILEEVL